jgi:hypothetical protein
VRVIVKRLAVIIAAVNSDFSVSFESPQSGWMSMRLKAKGQSFVAVMSHAPFDSLRDLINGFTAMLLRGDGFNVRWNAEPEQYEFGFEPKGNEVELTVIRYSKRAWSERETLFSFRGVTAEVCQGFWREFKHLRDRRETDVFEKNWRRAFPEHELQEFTQALKAHRHEP